MGENQIAPVEEQAVVAQVENDVAVVEDVDGKHKVLFYGLLGLICISGVGLPIAIWLFLRERKKTKQLTEEINKAKATTTEPAAPATEAPNTPQAETKPEETK